MKNHSALAFLVVLLLPVVGLGQEKTRRPAPDLSDVLPLLNAPTPESLAQVLRTVLIKYLPDPLYEAAPGWGEQRPAANGLHWNRGRVLPRPEVVKGMRNEGTWRKIRMNAVDLPSTLVVGVGNLQSPDPTRFTLELLVSFDARAEFEQQNWEKGLRLWSGSVRTRFRVHLHLYCEATTKLETVKGSLLPDVVFRVRATRAELSYDNLVFEHVPGVGGSGAKLIGNAFHKAMKKWHPSLEHNLLRRADGAIVRAADSREIRVSLSKLGTSVFEGQK
jgi:hypothetical protein